MLNMADISKEGVALRLAELVNDKGITQEELGAAADKTKQAGAAWLKTGRIHNSNLQKVADRYGYSFLWLLTEEGPKYQVHDIAHAQAVIARRKGQGEVHEPAGAGYRLPPDELALLGKYRRLLPGQKKVAQTVVDALDKSDMKTGNDG